MLSTVAGQERRRSTSSLTIGDKTRPRSASMGVIEVSPKFSGWSSQRAPSTPCFVSPRMAFSTQFSYDSPIQVLTSRSPCVFKPMAVPSLYRSWSLKKLPLRCKILLTILLLSLAGCLYIVRNYMGTETACTSPGQCGNNAHDHKDFKRYIRSASEPAKSHTLTSDLNNLDVEIRDKGMAALDEATTGSLTRVEPLAFINEKPKVIIGSNVDQSIDVSQSESGFPKGDSATLDQVNPLPLMTDSGIFSNPQNFQETQVDKNINGFSQLPDKALPKQDISERDIAARMTKHSGHLKNDRLMQRNYEQAPGFGRDRQSPDAWQGRYPEAPLRLDRLPPGINPKRYLREL